MRVAGVRVGRVEEISLYGTQAEVALGYPAGVAGAFTVIDDDGLHFGVCARGSSPLARGWREMPAGHEREAGPVPHLLQGSGRQRDPG
ncbi:hypothetical protein [Nonomuraea africana]|uniref:hypothetical protein n=1 Tax=Nonomuraea africana TaxID=46171 RepID=UPI0033E3BE46